VHTWEAITAERMEPSVRRITAVQQDRVELRFGEQHGSQGSRLDLSPVIAGNGGGYDVEVEDDHVCVVA
jgi:hypothetical protein